MHAELVCGRDIAGYFPTNVLTCRLTTLRDQSDAGASAGPRVIVLQCTAPPAGTKAAVMTTSAGVSASTNTDAFGNEEVAVAVACSGDGATAACRCPAAAGTGAGP